MERTKWSVQILVDRIYNTTTTHLCLGQPVVENMQTQAFDVTKLRVTLPTNYLSVVLREYKLAHVLLYFIHKLVHVHEQIMENIKRCLDFARTEKRLAL